MGGGGVMVPGVMVPIVRIMINGTVKRDLALCERPTLIAPGSRLNYKLSNYRRTDFWWYGARVYRECP